MGIADNINIGGAPGDRTEAVKVLFPAKNKLQMLQMLSETSTQAEIPMSMLGLFRRSYNSKVLGVFQEELLVNKVAQERKGRLEAEAILVSVPRDTVPVKEAE